MEKMDEETERDIINDFRAGIIGITNKNVTIFINHTKKIKNYDLLASIYWFLSMYYLQSKCYNECVKFLKLYQNNCKDRQIYGDSYTRTYFFLSECYIKIGEVEKGIEIFEKFLIKYKRDNERHGVPPLDGKKEKKRGKRKRKKEDGRFPNKKGFLLYCSQ